MSDSLRVKKLLQNIESNQAKLEKIKKEMDEIWQDTGLDPNDQSYLVEKTLRFEIAKEKLDKLFHLFANISDDYKRLLSETTKEEE